MKKRSARRQSPAAANLLTRRAPVRATTFDPTTGDFSAVIATGTPVQRRDAVYGDYFEVLSLAPKSVRLDRLKSGASPILDSHRSGSARDQIGIVTDARIEGGKLIAEARLSPRDDVKPIAADLAAGTAPNVSVGYRVYASVESRDQAGNLIVTHTDWEPYEVSLVAIPADPQTHVRNQKGNSMKTRNQETPIIETDDEDEIETPHDGGDEHTRSEDRTMIRMSRRQVSEAYSMASRSGLPAEFARQHIESGRSLEQFRTALFDRLADDADRTRINNISPAYGSESFSNPDFLGRSISDALYSKMTGKAPTGAAVELAGRSMLELGAMVLQSRGERVSWANRTALAGRIMERSHSTSDFPILLQGAGARVLLDAYKAAETPLKNLARRKEVRDFRPVTAARLSEAPALLKVNELGEIKHGSRAEAKEMFSIDTYARIFSISRNALINDDLGAFADTSADFGRAAATTEADLMAGLLLANAGDGSKLDDGNPVFGIARGNKAAAGTAITVAALGAGRRALREMKGLDGKTPISVTPKHLVVGAAKETEAEQVLAALAAAQVSEANPFSGKLVLQVEPRLTGNAWRLFADPSEIATMVIAYLAGVGGPQIEVRDGWDVLGMEFRAVFDFGCAMQDWRGSYLNPGA